MNMNWKDLFWKMPPLPAIRGYRGLRYFRSNAGYGMHWGRFASFAEASAWLPRSAGFDTEEFSNEYLAVRTQKVFGFDYPAMISLASAFREGARTVWDIGGSVGSQYFAYRRFLEYPQDLQWRVCELPASVRRGREYAAQMGATGLSFFEDLACPESHCDVWMAAGTIEFIEGGVQKLMRDAKFRPRHLILNKVPMHDGAAFVSTQNLGGGCFAPHDVYNRQQLVSELESHGYSVIDSWKVPERSFLVPGRPEESFGHYVGLYARALHPSTASVPE